MGLFRKRRNSGDSSGTPPTPAAAGTPPTPRVGPCGCAEHVQDLADMRIPVSGSWRDQLDEEHLSVADLLEAGALGVDRVEPEERIEPALAWQLWVGDEARVLYDDAAEPLDEVLTGQPGIQQVVWEDREILHVQAQSLCADGILAAAARTLADPRVRVG